MEKRNCIALVDYFAKYEHMMNAILDKMSSFDVIIVKFVFWVAEGKNKIRKKMTRQNNNVW